MLPEKLTLTENTNKTKKILDLTRWQIEHPLEDYLWYHADVVGNHSVDSLLDTPSHFTRLSQKPFAFPVMTHRYKVHLDHRVSQREWYFFTGVSSSPLLRAYWLSRGKKTLIYESLAELPYRDRPVDHHSLIIPLHATAGECGTLFIESRSIAGFPLVPRLGDQQALRKVGTTHSLLNGILLGALFVFFAFFFLQFLIQPTHALGYYCLFVVSVSLFIGQVFGYNFQYLWPNQGVFNSHFISVIAGFVYVWYFLFTATLFDLKVRNMRLYQLAVMLAGLTALLSLVGLFFDVAYFITVVTLLGLLVPIVIGVWAKKNDLPSATFFLVGSSIHCGLTYSFIAMCMGVDIGRPQYVFVFVSLGIVFDLSMFSAAILYQSDRLRGQLNAHLRRQVADMKALVMSEQERSTSQSRSQQHILNLATTAHDLQQPLSAINMAASLIDGDKLNPVKKNIDAAVEYMRELLSLVLNDTKQDYAALKKTVDVPAFLAGIKMRHAGAFAEKGLRLRVHSSVTQLSCLPIMLNRIIDNLLVNALRYTREGGVLLSIRARDNAVLIQIWDTGSGIPAAKVHDMLSPYKQLSQAELDQVGYGLGLYIIKTLCDQTGYDLCLRSRLGRGSCFGIAIPSTTSVQPRRNGLL